MRILKNYTLWLIASITFLLMFVDENFKKLYALAYCKHNIFADVRCSLYFFSKEFL